MGPHSLAHLDLPSGMNLPELPGKRIPNKSYSYPSFPDLQGRPADRVSADLIGMTSCVLMRSDALIGLALGRILHRNDTQRWACSLS